jgi:hypothetical protein
MLRGMVPDHELSGIARSAAMLAPGATVSVDRDVLIAIVEELVETRSLVARLGADLTTVARRRRDR